MGQLTDAGNTTTLAHYQRLLESAFLIRGLPKWSGNVVRQRSSSPKWLPLNTALVTALANRTFNQWKNEPAAWGRLVEITVGAHLVNNSLSQGADVYYWRDGNYEIDYIVHKGDKLIAIEVKSGAVQKTLPSLGEFAKRYQSTKTIVVGAPELSLREFLETPVQKWLS